MKQGIKEGYILPKSLILKIIPQFEILSKTKIEDHLFFTPIKKFPIFHDRFIDRPHFHFIFLTYFDIRVSSAKILIVPDIWQSLILSISIKNNKGPSTVP